jgi:MoxR-like ATPase
MSKDPVQAAKDVRLAASKVIANLEKVILGKRNQLNLVLIAYLAEGHILLEDVPGVAKTMLARALARSISASFKRIQCTPDLMPGDITGVNIFNQKTVEFEFRAGPIFCQTFLADEINRATPRAQSALLEAMAERKVSVDGQTFSLKPPFLVIATQNPVDQEGTFPLPEAQLDRFLIKLGLGYPSPEEEIKLLGRLQKLHPIDEIGPVISAQDWIACQEAVKEIHVDPKIRKYIVEIVNGTREHEDVALGGSPRASLALMKTAQAVAAMEGRPFVTPDDVKKMVQPVLGHRIILRPESRMRKVSVAALVKDVVSDVKVPILEETRGKDHFAN